jgi:membrane fusion protein, multidrug efflux system
MSTTERAPADVSETPPLAVAGATAPQPPPAARPSRRPIAMGILGILALIGLSLAVRHLLWARVHVRTDNAQVEGSVVPVLAKVSGFVTEVAVHENQPVRAGDLLVRLDDREYQAKRAQNEADLEVAEAVTGGHGRVGQGTAQVAAAQAAVTQAQANADRARADVERYRTLAPRGVVSQQQLDAAEAAAAATTAQLKAARDQVLAATASLHGADAKVAAARAQRDQSDLNVTWTRITAPLSGMVSRRSVEVGQLVSAGQPLMSVVPLDDVWVVANLKETEIAGVDVGDRAEIEADAYHGRRFAARVESISAATGAKFSLLPPDNATGNFTKVVQRIPVRVRLDGPQDPAHPLRPGMSVQVTITKR